jgi:amino acid transporter
MAASVETTDFTATVSKKGLWTGRILSGLAVLFLVFDGVTKVMKVPAVMQASAQMQYPLRLIPVIGIVLLVCTAVYAIPRTSILGAILLTGYLGGAVEAQLRAGNPLFAETLFPVYFSVLIWGGLFLRERRLRALLPFRSQAR